jgi:hypothetical protein
VTRSGRTCRGAAFTAESVLGIMAGTKTQSRRMVKGVPDWATQVGVSAFTPPGQFSARGSHPEHGPAEHFIRCPYGVAGGLLWVRETWKPDVDTDGITSCVTYRDGTRIQIENSREAADRWLAARRPQENWPRMQPPSWRSPRHMPKWASRITLELASVRVERLLAITGEDILAEGVVASGQENRRLTGPNLGCCWVSAFDGMTYSSLSDLWAAAWDAINGETAPAASNPWVWRLEFRKLEVRS